MEKVFRHLHRVTYAECTEGNHVYYGRYLDWLEAARGEFFRSQGRTFLEWQKEGFIFPVLEAHLVYRAPARYDDLVEVEVGLKELKGVRVSFAYRIIRGQGPLLVEGETRHVCTGLDEKPRRLPEALMKWLEPWSHAVQKSE